MVSSENVIYAIWPERERNMSALHYARASVQSPAVVNPTLNVLEENCARGTEPQETQITSVTPATDITINPHY